MQRCNYQDALDALKENGDASSLNTLNMMLLLNVPIWPPISTVGISAKDLKDEVISRMDFIKDLVDQISQTTEGKKKTALLYKIQILSGPYFYSDELPDLRSDYPPEKSKELDKSQLQNELAFAIINNQEATISELIEKGACIDKEILEISQILKNQNVKKIIEEKHKANEEKLKELINSNDFNNHYKELRQLLQQDHLLYEESGSLSQIHINEILHQTAKNSDVFLFSQLLLQRPELTISSSFGSYVDIICHLTNDTKDPSSDMLRTFYRFQNIKREFPLASEDKILLHDAILKGNFEFIINSKTIPDEECLRFAFTQQDNPEIKSLIQRLFLEPRIKKAIESNDTVALEILLSLSNHSSDNLKSYLKEALEKKHIACFQVLASTIGYEAIPELYKEDNLVFQKLYNLKFNINSPLGIDLITYLLKKADVKTMKAIIDSGFRLDDMNNEKTFNLSTLPFKLGMKQKDFLTFLDLLIKDFNYSLDLQQLELILSNFKDKPEAKVLTEWGFKLSSVNFTKEAIRLGHILGLSKPIMVTAEVFSKSSKMGELKVEGNANFESLNYLIEKITDYAQNSPNDSKLSTDFNEILDGFTFTRNQYSSSNSINVNSPQELLERYKAGKITCLIGGWPGHTVSITLKGDHLIFCNRGEGGDQAFGTKIYKINQENITKEWISNLFDKSKSQNDFNATLNQVIDQHNPIAKFPSKGQKHGTCSYVNQLSSIEGMLCLLDAQRSNRSIEEAAEEMSKLEVRRQSPYKNFTTFNRDSEIKNLIKKMESDTEKDPNALLFYFEAFKVIILEHHGQTVNPFKKKDEERIVQQLFAALPVEYQIKMRKEFANHPGITRILTSTHTLNYQLSKSATPNMQQEIQEQRKEEDNRNQVENPKDKDLVFKRP